MNSRTLSQALVDRTAARLAGPGLSRRRFLTGTAVVGSAIVVAPRRFMLEPGDAYAVTIDTVCGPDAGCDARYTAFCCTVNDGVNQCPAGTFPGGWWRADGSSWCCGGSRYIIDCNAECSGCGCAPGTTICADSCQNCSHYCNPGPTCDQRRVCMNRFRYGQCNQQIGCSGDVFCRMVSCTPPWQIAEFACVSGPVFADQTTAEHSAPCLQHASWQGGAAAIRPDGVVESSPSIAEVRGHDRADAFVLGSDGNYWWTRQQGGGWSPWASIGTPPVGGVSKPAVVSWAPDRLDVFVRGRDNKLWQTFSTNGGVSWSGWIQPVGNDGVLASSPAVVSWAPNRIDVFVLGIDGQLWHRWYDNGWNGGWEPRGAPGIGLVGNPAAVSWGGPRIDVFMTGNDAHLYQCYYSNGWSGWFQPPGTENRTLTSSPAAASWGVDEVAVFAQSTDKGLWWTNYFRGYWSDWGRVGGPGDVFVAEPSAASRGCQQFDVLVQGTDKLCYRFRYSG